MQYKSIAAALALVASASAQGRPSNTSICDYYTTALLKNNTAANQLTILTLLVNTVVIGNYTKPKIEGVTFPDVKVPGILANGTVNGEMVNLLPYFDGGLASSNRGDKAVAINFLDDGGAVPLMMNKPANGTSSNQYRLLTHLYEFFGTLLGCSQQGMAGYEAYAGNPSMFQVHKFMYLNENQNMYFIQQVGLAAQSFGVADSDVQAVAKTLTSVFNVKCAAAAPIPGLGSYMQSICVNPSCPLAMNSTCEAYPAAMAPAVANATLAMGQGNASASVTATAANGGAPVATGSMASTSGAGGAKTTSIAGSGAQQVVGSGLAAGLGLFAFLL